MSAAFLISFVEGVQLHRGGFFGRAAVFANVIADRVMLPNSVVLESTRIANSFTPFFITRVSFRKKKSTKNIDAVPGKEGDATAPSPAGGDVKPSEESREPEVCRCGWIFRI